MPKKLLLIFLTLIISLRIAPMADAKKDDDKKFTVVIDAGHGGKDVGATDNGVMEKNINLKVAKQLESLIRKKLKDTQVVMTRDNDSYLTLQERAEIANKSQGDLFISIHTNSLDRRNSNRKSIAGSSVYTLGLHKDEDNLQVAMRENAVIELENDYEQKYSGFDPQRDESYIIFEMAQKKNLSQSIKLAESIGKELVATGRQDRGIHQAGFWVLWATSMPSVLVELDFICNPNSAAYMNSDKGAKELATAIFRAVEKYESSWNKKNNLPDNKSAQQTFSEADEPELSNSYLAFDSDEIAIAPSRRKKIHAPETNNIGKKNYLVDKRRRRSLSAKKRQEDTSYEYMSLQWGAAVPKYSVEAFDENLLIASAAMESAPDPKASKKNKKKEKQPKKAKEKKKTTPSRNARVNKLVTVYKIQIFASEDLLNQGSEKFCGLSPISAYKENDLYKYYYGESTDRGELETVLRDVKKKIPDAFIVASTKSVKSDKESMK